jgi:hypothetical protein
MKIKELPAVLWRSVQLWISHGNLPEVQRKGVVLPVVVSLTSIPSRLGILHLTILSILSAPVRPAKIILWLNESLQGRLPRRLTGLQGECFEIRFAPGTSSHRKLVLTLREMPDATIVTCDDDVMYPQDWLSRLYVEHQAKPGCVIGHTCRVIAYTASGELLPYKYWKYASPGACGPEILPIGVGGVLYPPGSLHPDVLDETLYMRLAPRADDLWFKVMAVRQGVMACSSVMPTEVPLPCPLFSDISLGDSNVKLDMNRVQLDDICRYYGMTLAATSE